MSAPVDVRAALAAAITKMRACDCTGSVETLLDVDAAAAELIEATPALIEMAAGRTPVSLGTLRRAEAALARCKGGSA